jgi:KUP system potassium uptake protein
VKLLENPISHDRSKHVEIKFHYIRDMVQRKEVLVQYLPTDEKITDFLTKALSKSKFEYFHDKFGMVGNIPLVKREC